MTCEQKQSLVLKLTTCRLFVLCSSYCTLGLRAKRRNWCYITVYSCALSLSLGQSTSLHNLEAESEHKEQRAQCWVCSRLSQRKPNHQEVT